MKGHMSKSSQPKGWELFDIAVERRSGWAFQSCAQVLLASLGTVCDDVTENSIAITPESVRLVQAQKTLVVALDEEYSVGNAYVIEAVLETPSKTLHIISAYYE